MREQPFFTAELAARIGRGVDWLYRHWPQLEADGLPKPLTQHGRKAWDRATMEAWLGRHHPHAPKYPAANDTAPPATPAGDAEWREHLSHVYAGGNL